MSEREIFIEALQKEGGRERSAFLGAACGHDTELRGQVERLLAEHAKDDSFFIDSPPPGFDATIDQPITEKPGTLIDRYKLLEQIGEGGFGVVFMAEQEEPVRRKVAVKVIKPGMDTKEVIARFEAERQALAIMNHPNIAKVLDAGATESGRPYFVMELVRGIPITEFCDQNNLSTHERLELFSSVCQAVQHAHQKGIIHRDIKPTNVMVTLHDDRPVPKVIDFGVAKATNARLTERTLFTRFAQMVGTPLYMSPEQTQISGLDVDTRSDVYSLGVLLYELLTGTTPFDRKRIREAAYDELVRIIREEEPPKPSTRISSLGDTAGTASIHRKTDPKHLSQFLRGDLDWIVMKALEKDRTRRYETANGFAADIQRYLNDEPVEACPPSAAYRFRKFARRNKATLATASMVAAALVFGMIGTAWQAVRAKQQAARATQAEGEARAAEGEATTERDVAKTERNHAVEAKQLADDRLARAVKAEKAARNSNLVAEQAKQLETELRQRAEDQLASSYVDRGQLLCEQGEVGRGMLWLAHSLQTAPEDAVDLRRAIRVNLAAWHNQLHSLSTVVQFEGRVWALAISPDGSRILTGSKEGVVQLWNAATGEAIGEPLPHEGGVPDVAFSPGGRRIVTGCADGAARVWDTATQKLIGEPLEHTPVGEPLKLANQVKIVAFSPDGSRIVTASGGGSVGKVRLWDATTFEPVGEPFEEGSPEAIASCPDGLRVLTRVSGTREQMQLQLWNLDRGEQIGPSVELGVFRAAAISPDGSLLATAENDGGHIKLWRAETGEPALEPIVHGGVVLALAFSPDGSRLLSGGNTRASMVWDTATGRPVGTPLRQQSTARHLAYSADGRRIATDSADGSVRVWNVARDKTVGRVIEHKDQVVAAGYCLDGLRILTGSDGSVQLRNAATGDAIGKPFSQFGRMDETGAFSHLMMSPDGKQVLIRSDPAQLGDVATGQMIGRPFPHLYGVVFGPDGSRILTGVWLGRASAAQLWDAATGESLGKPLPHQKTVHPVAFSPDGSRLLTGSYDGTTRLWDAATLEPIGEPLVHQSEVKALAYHPDGVRILIGFADGTVRLWDLASRTPIGVPLHHRNVVSSVAFSPGGARFLTCSLDQTAQLWDTATGKPIGPLLKHNSWWPEGSFSPDGAEFLVTGIRETAQRWEAPPGPLEGDREQIVLWTEVITGLELDSSDGIGALDGPTWQERYRRLQELGGPPSTAPLPPPAPKADTDFSRSMKIALDGRGRAASGQWDEADDDFTRAIQLSDDSPTLRYQVACWWDKLAEDNLNSGHDGAYDGLCRRAVAIIEKLREEFPDELTYLDKLGSQFLSLARVHRNMGRLEDAQQAERQLVSLYPEEWSSRLKIANAFVSRGGNAGTAGNSVTAERLFTRALCLLHSVIFELGDQSQQYPQQLAQCHRLLGKVHASFGRTREAIDSYNRAREILPQHAWAYSDLAELLVDDRNPDLRDPAEALQHAGKAVELMPGNARFLGSLGRVCYRAGDYAAAAGALEKPAGGPQDFVSVPRCATDRFYLAMAHWRLGHEQEARRWYGQAVDLAETLPYAEALRRVRAEATELLGAAKEVETDEQPAAP